MRGSFLGITGFKSLITYSGPGVWHQKDNPLTGLNTSVAYRRVVRKPNHALEELSQQKLVYSQCKFRGSRLKTALASAQLARTTSTHPQALSGILLQPLAPALFPVKAEAAIANNSKHMQREQSLLQCQPCLWPGWRQSKPVCTLSVYTLRKKQH